MSHLLGPWKIDGQFDDGVDVGIVDCDGNEILGVSPQDGVDLDEWGERSLAIARVVVAAPELLDALKGLAPFCRESNMIGESDWERAWMRAESAMAKAEGKKVARRKKP